MVLLGFRGGRASTPKRGLGFLLCFIFPAIKQIRSNTVTPARLRDVPALQPFLDDLPLLFRDRSTRGFLLMLPPLWRP
jgi:hypothetical protein